MGDLRFEIDLRDSVDRLLVNVFNGSQLVAHFLCRRQECCSNCYPEMYCDPQPKMTKLWIMQSGPQVLRDYQRLGIASSMYRLAEVHFRCRIMPDGKASAEGNALRASYERKY